MKLEKLSMMNFGERVYENLANSSVKKASYDLTNHHFQKNNIYANLAKLSLDEPSIYSTLVDSIGKNPTYENVALTNVYMNLKDVEDKSLKSIETDVLDKHSSNTTTDNGKNKFEINQTPNYHDKSDLYRTKMSSTMIRILPSLRQRRSLHRPRRYRRRSITPFRSNSNRRQQQQQQPPPQPQQQQLQTMNSKRQVTKSVTNQLYNELSQTFISQTEHVFAYPVQFQPIIAYYPTQQFTTKLESRESIQKEGEEETGGDDEQDDEEEEEELYQHETFEDFLLARPKSSNSTVASITNTLISSETISPEVHLPSTKLNRRSSGLTLSLDKKDVDFIHNIIQRTHGNQRVSNRIVALKEAYLRAEMKRTELLKNQKCPTTKKVTPKHSFITSKVRDELEKYDELPAHRRTPYSEDDYDDDDDDDDDAAETYSLDRHYRRHYHRRLPQTPSKTYRFVHFIVSLKRQIQKNIQDFRETLSQSRHRQQFYVNNPLVILFLSLICFLFYFRTQEFQLIIIVIRQEEVIIRITLFLHDHVHSTLHLICNVERFTIELIAFLFLFFVLLSCNKRTSRPLLSNILTQQLYAHDNFLIYLQEGGREREREKKNTQLRTDMYT